MATTVPPVAASPLCKVNASLCMSFHVLRLHGWLESISNFTEMDSKTRASMQRKLTPTRATQSRSHRAQLPTSDFIGIRSNALLDQPETAHHILLYAKHALIHQHACTCRPQLLNKNADSAQNTWHSINKRALQIKHHGITPNTNGNATMQQLSTLQFS